VRSAPPRVVLQLHADAATAGYVCLSDVTHVPAPQVRGNRSRAHTALVIVCVHWQRDNMESFFLAETLKYLYLLFADPSEMPLDKARLRRLPAGRAGRLMITR
jgi:hypothetical protein